ncbi:hypothetical protein SAMN05216345_105307 [Cupriavidus sp. YR651]|uniref:hypothetical protein n=1 Tax=Cupriavidus sp. YR651 TaxID=1855315 RepID=UPI000891ED2F|nr:hypothetical protein [Cupriavidus sp. YR651]SDD03552.1 hypothetical protein SAMN05216345_105307 [Cupriavidus sp. YR651]
MPRPIPFLFRLTVAATLALIVPIAAQAAGGTALSSGPVAGSTAGGQGGALGINEAIRDGEARRGAALSTGPIGPLAPRAEYARLPVYVGNVGDKSVRLRIGPKSDTRDSLQGEYTTGDAKGVRLLSGEWENGAFLMEESDDGTRVSGNWEGQIDQNGAVRGTWTDAFNPAIVLPFFIRPFGGYLVIPPFDMRPNSGVTYAPPPPKSSISVGNPR